MANLNIAEHGAYALQPMLQEEFEAAEAELVRYENGETEDYIANALAAADDESRSLGENPTTTATIRGYEFDVQRSPSFPLIKMMALNCASMAVVIAERDLAGAEEAHDVANSMLEVMRHNFGQPQDPNNPLQLSPEQTYVTHIALVEAYYESLPSNRGQSSEDWKLCVNAAASDAFLPKREQAVRLR